MNKAIANWYEKHSNEVITLSEEMWAHPESAFEEYYACQKTAEFMRKHGFDVKEINAQNNGNPPNCVIARYGSGKPVIGILGEFDALNGLGQEKSACHLSVAGPGHGCGHNLMGAGCAAAAAALKLAMEEENLSGTVIYYGCPAEETIEGKVWMASEGLFDELDMCIAWHPMNTPPTVSETSSQASTNINFKFFGKTAHAAANPEMGRSALDAAELMNIGVQYLREHVTDDVRMHYVYTHAGDKPNIVPGYAELNYYIRAKTREIDDEVIERVKEVARGAAIMTGTDYEVSLNAGCYDTLILHSINRFLYESAAKIPEIEYTAEEVNYAKEIYKNAIGAEAKEDFNVLPVKLEVPTGMKGHSAGSTDVGDVSHIVPTSQLMGPGMVAGLPVHHWSVVSAAGSSIGHKAEIYAGKALAQCGYDALKNPAVIEEFKAEFKEARKHLKPYKAVLDK